MTKLTRRLGGTVRGQPKKRKLKIGQQDPFNNLFVEKFARDPSDPTGATVLEPPNTV